MSAEDCFASLDLGGTTLQGLLATGDGDVLAERQVPTESFRGSGAVLDSMAGLVEALALEGGATPCALGVGCPGLVDSGTGEALCLPNFPDDWRGVQITRELGRRLDLPVHVLNDVRMATLGELDYGLGSSRRDPTFVLFALGTGIGGGVVVDGRLRLGPSGSAGELGHMLVAPQDGPVCGCGGRGCLESVASAPALVGEATRLLRSNQTPRLAELAAESAVLTVEMVAAAATAGDEALIAAIERVSGHLATAIVNSVVMVQPDLVVLAGGLAQMGDQLLEPVRREFRARCRFVPVEHTTIELSPLGYRTGALGGIALARRGGVDLATRSFAAQP